MARNQWVRIPPKEDDSPEEIRRQRDLYRELHDLALLRDIENWDVENLVFDPESQKEVEAIIAELRDGIESR